MSRKSSGHLTAEDQLILHFDSNENDNSHVIVGSDNVVMFDNNRQWGASNRECQKRERIINKLLSHAERLRW